MIPSVFNWSGGKESALALYRLQLLGKHDISSLVTVLSAEFKRASLHAVRKSLIEQQAQSLGVPIEFIPIPDLAGFEKFEAIAYKQISDLCRKGVEMSIYGDINKVGLRNFRELEFQGLKLKPHYPLWQIPSYQLAREFINLGFKAVVTCVDAKKLNSTFAGMNFDHDFLRELPNTVDPCGENGEFYTFVYDGPNFKTPVKFDLGELSYKHVLVDHKQKSLDSAYWWIDLQSEKAACLNENTNSNSNC